MHEKESVDIPYTGEVLTYLAKAHSIFHLNWKASNLLYQALWRLILARASNQSSILRHCFNLNLLKRSARKSSAITSSWWWSCWKWRASVGCSVSPKKQRHSVNSDQDFRLSFSLPWSASWRAHLFRRVLMHQISSQSECVNGPPFLSRNRRLSAPAPS